MVVEWKTVDGFVIVTLLLVKRRVDRVLRLAGVLKLTGVLKPVLVWIGEETTGVDSGVEM